MKEFLKKVSILSSILLVMICFVFMNADGYSDAYYKRFTTKRKSNLILGTSRSAQGIVPSILNNHLNPENEFFNFSFTLAHSPYGDIYTQAIKKKLSLKSKGDEIFILSVDPWCISCDSEKEELREKGSFLENLNFLNLSYNFEYLSRFYEKRYISILVPQSKKLHLHEDGWLEVDNEVNIKQVRRRTQLKKDEYTNLSKKYSLCSHRYEALENLIVFLSQRGRVFLVRIPVSNMIYKIESKFEPHYKKMIEEIKSRTQVKYFDFTHLNDKLQFNDGNHLHRESAIQFTKILSDSIKKYVM